MEEHFVDVRDGDVGYTERVRVWLDRVTDRYHLPRESAERLGKPAADGTYHLFAGTVIARPIFVGFKGDTVRVWTVPVRELATRPASSVLRELA